MLLPVKYQSLQFILLKLQTDSADGKQSKSTSSMIFSRDKTQSAKSSKRGNSIT